MDKYKTLYHNSTNLNGRELFENIKNAANQEEIVAEIFRKRGKLSASEVYNIYPVKSVPITSIRRAMSNLKNKGIIRKTEQKKTGIYGKPEYLYEYVI